MSLMLGRKSSQRGKRPCCDDRNQTGNTTDFVGLMTEPFDIRQVRVPTVAVGLVLSVAAIVGTVTWSSARLVARIDHLEATVSSIEQTMDMNAYARSVDLEDLQVTVHALGVAVEDLGDMIDDDWAVED